MIKWLEITSKAIANFPMGDSAVRRMPILLPDNYDKNRAEPYPLIVVLAGYGSHPEKFVYANSVFDRPLAAKLSQAMSDKSMPEAIVVFPDCTSKLGGSQFINSPAFGHYMDYLCNEIITEIDQKFHTYKDRNYRAITGHSSGGYGAMVTSMLRPDVFAHMASSAGDCFFEALFKPLITPTLIAVKQAGSIEKFIELFLNDLVPGNRGNFEAMMMLAMAPCFAPNCEAPTILGDLFFDLNDGHIKEGIWQKYLSWDPVHMTSKYLEAWAQMKTIRLDCGRSDPYGMQWGQQQIASLLQANGIKVALNEYSGGHNRQGPRTVDRIRALLSAISRKT
jgi:enterochelin esterase family protein